MKICKKCLIEKELSEFYVCKGNSDGRFGTCKDCTKDRVKKHRSKNIDEIRAYDRGRGRTEKRLKLNRDRYKACNLTEEQKQKMYESVKRYRRENAEKYRCHSLVGHAINSGKLVKPNRCSECGEDNATIHGHHENYMRPLDVIWLCPTCHRRKHKTYKD